MSCNNFDELKKHIGHNIRCVGYYDGDNLYNVSIECDVCHEVILDFEYE